MLGYWRMHVLLNLLQWGFAEQEEAAALEIREKLNGLTLFKGLPSDYYTGRTASFRLLIEQALVREEMITADYYDKTHSKMFKGLILVPLGLVNHHEAGAWYLVAQEGEEDDLSINFYLLERFTNW